ncbi:hypothetical protein TCAL_07432 [Tigriopus californicus]|uniref:Rap-GAP domain-containing protein n=1 Tax=Tigriopus californicus TaxID=6832 RepID=A0A553PGC3_TIGCA|nr:hypothetical protein TCAL_07432 [Tigriopus californicus]
MFRFRGSKGPSHGSHAGGPPGSAASAAALQVLATEPKLLNLSPEQIQALASSSPLEDRIRIITELTPRVRGNILEEHSVELLWMKTKDLLEAQDPSHRVAVIQLFTALVEGQFEHLDVMRGQFFRVIECHKSPEDFPHLLNLLDALTRQGKDILHFEEKIGRFLLQVFPTQPKPADVVNQYLLILLNTIKFNPAYLDPEVVTGLINCLSCHTGLVNDDDGVTGTCLQCFFAIMGFSYIPKEALTTFICTLCRVVNMPAHCKEAWRIMGNLMGTHLGHSALYCLCQIIQSREYQNNVPLVRGAVFFVGRSLWGNPCVKTMRNYSAMTILPSFIQALNCQHQVVTYEVTLQLERLIIERGETLRAPGCDCALDLIEAILVATPKHAEDSMKKEIFKHIHDTLNSFENLIDQDNYRGSKKKLFSIIDLCSSQRPEESVVRLLDYRAISLFPTKSGWIRGLHTLMDKYYKNDPREVIRIKALEVMASVVRANRHMYEEDMLERVVLPFLRSLDHEQSRVVRLEGIKVLTSLCTECSSKEAMKMVDIIERILLRQWDSKKSPGLSYTDHDHTEARIAVTGVIHAFKVKISQYPPSFIVRIYQILAKLVEEHYAHPEIYGNTGSIRIEIFRLFLALRADENYHLGICDEDSGSIRYSPFIVCRDFASGGGPAEILSGNEDQTRTRSGGIHKSGGGGSAPNASQPATYMSLTKACMLVIKSLSEERDWTVLKLVLSKVPMVLQNKAIITRYGKAIYMFITPLVELTSRNSKYPEVLVNTLPNFSRSEFHNTVFPVLAAMASYNEFLEPSSQRSLINALHVGLLSRECNRICIMALTACALEMKKSMYHVIPEVVLNFSKISATKLIATPMLEFLSTLIRLPDIFSSFTDTNYMAVFAIALPFTNPFRFDAYTVSLAHHIIIMWFLKCRLSYRQNFVQFIMTGLNSNVIQSFEEGNYRKIAANVATAAASRLANMDSADRKRSSSLSEHSIKPRDRAQTAVTTKVSTQKGSGASDELSEEHKRANKMISFHQELTETCVDILARYMFANASVQPKRLPTTQFLLKEGHSATWLLNTMLITITTSHCDQTSNRGGLCDRCHLICSKTRQEDPLNSVHLTQPEESSSSGTFIQSPEGEISNVRKRHQSEFQAQRPSPSRYLPGSSARDDFDLRRQVSAERISSQLSNPVPSQQVPQPSDSENDVGLLESLMKEQKGQEIRKPDLCACWCNGWAEIFVRRPSGDVSWMCRIQNSSLVSDSYSEFPLADLAALFRPSNDLAIRESVAQMLDMSKRIPIDTLSEKEYESLTSDKGDPRESFSLQGCRASITAESDSSTHSNVDRDSNPSSGQDPASPASPSEPRTELKNSGTSSNRQSCGPIPEVEEEEPIVREHRTSSELLQRRRISLQHGGAPNADSTENLKLKINSPLKTGSPMRSREASGTPPTLTPISGPASSGVGSRPPKLLLDSSMRRDRAHTISGPSPRRFNRDSASGTGSAGIRRGPEFLRSQTSGGPSSERAERVTGISPQFVFLQLYHNSSFGNTNSLDQPILLPATKAIETSIKNLDRIHAHETHKIGVLYIDPGQEDNEEAILLNEFGSLRYTQFLHGLGDLISLKDVDKKYSYVGGLDHVDGDGDFAYMWEDDVMQANKKKRHIGNDFVVIVYNNSGGHYKMGTVKGQFINACIVITPLDQGSNKVFIDCKPELDEPLGHVKDPKIVSDRNLAILVRQLALHCNLAAQIQQTLGLGRDPYSSNWLERLRQIKRIRDKVSTVSDDGSKSNASNGKDGGDRASNDNSSSSSSSRTERTSSFSRAALNDFTNIVMRRISKDD